MDTPTGPSIAASADPNTNSLVVDDPLSNPYNSLNSLCNDLSNLQDLACRGAWRTILDKIARARSLSLLTKPHEHLIYLTFNLLGLVKLRRFNDAYNELQSHIEDSNDGDDDDNPLNSPQYHYQTYPHHYPDQKGSMVPFALRWLYAHLPSTVGHRQLALDRFYALLDFVREKRRNHDGKSGDLWQKREVFVVNSIVSYHLSAKEFKVCVDLLRGLVSEDEFGVDSVLLSKLGYMQMQYGDLEGAKRTFGEVEKLVRENGNNEEVPLSNLVRRNKALLYLVGKDYVSAVREYDECIERDGQDVIAINNKALCLMYLRDLTDSIKVLENALERVPTVALNETLVVNLCSMYELAYVNHADIKRTLSNWIARVAPDDFDSSSTRT
ncbi:OLC1v1033528C1 [Oldenlandia corymbosa var. corymbosa]|uniref:OLC1v1033528C1 n=1 Tax=Oldenlandia corymbosa var. corymbosa TaxID=529605 RepID=A0AAV1CNJ2_OLDCO|nr:OLC1v1033528C1 [Oldenlandia corymbosa var. corymbosa]